MKILVFAEQRDGKLKKASLEAMSVGRDLADATGGSAAAVLLGQGVSGLAEALAKAGAEKVFVGDDALFAQYSNDAYGLAVGKAAQAFGAEALLFSGTAMGKDLAPKVTARLGIGLLSDATTFSAAGGTVTFQRPIYAGKAFATLAPPAGKAFGVTLRPNVFPVKENAKAGEVVALDHGVTAGDLKAVVEKILTAQGELLDVAEANVIVSGGRGMKGPENYKILEELAARARRRGGRIPCGRGCGLDRALPPGGSDRQGREPRALHRLRHQRRHPAPGGHVQLQGHRGRQQGPGGAHLQGGQLRHRGRPLRGRAPHDPGRQGAKGPRVDLRNEARSKRGRRSSM